MTVGRASGRVGEGAPRPNRNIGNGKKDQKSVLIVESPELTERVGMN